MSMIRLGTLGFNSTFCRCLLFWTDLQNFIYIIWLLKQHYMIFLFCCRSLVSWHPVLLSKSGAQYTWSFCDSQTNDIDIQYCCDLPKWLVHALSLSFYHRCHSVIALNCMFVIILSTSLVFQEVCPILVKSSNSGLSKQTLIYISQFDNALVIATFQEQNKTFGSMHI